MEEQSHLQYCVSELMTYTTAIRICDVGTTLSMHMEIRTLQALKKYKW